MQAIILAAGMGRRLGKYTRDNTKCMLPVNGVKLIDRMLEQLCQLNLSRLVLVVGYKGKELMDYIGDRYNDRLHIEYAENPVYDKTNNIYSLALVKDKMVEDDTLLIESDLILDDSLFQMILDDPYPNLALVAKYETWMDGTMVRIDKENNIVNFVPKKAFKYSEVYSYYKTVNVYKFSKEFSTKVYVPFLDAYCKVMGNNEYYEQVLRVITLLDQANLKALPIGDKPWYEIDDVQDKDIAEAIFAEEKDKLQKYHVRYGGYWRFPQMLDFCYLVNPFFPPKRMRDEMRANFDELLTQYPSGMAVNSLLAGKYFGVSSQYIVVGNGAAELIKSLMEQLMEQGSKVGVVYPTFEEYPHRLTMDAIVPFFPNNPDLHYSADELKAFYKSKDINALLLVNPDNPSGNYIPKGDVLALAAWCAQHGIRLVVDESFVDFSDGGPANSLLNDDILEKYPELLVMKSISKSYGVPGLRLGVLAGADTVLLDKMKKDVAIWNINSFEEFYMQIFNKYETLYKTACKKFVEERNSFYKCLSSIPFLKVVPTQANFFLCQITEHYTSRQLTELLLNGHNILIKDCDSKTGLEGKNFIRLAIRDQQDNDLLIEVLKSL
jgi:histidinol-phosphate/aromatic aminotransferase/cobyric acid decarboxylase-like protein/GTP:adenosylcobinamide-phosphate guanylyltransferase